MGELAGVTIGAEHELSEIIAADGEAIEALSELIRQESIRRDSRHYEDLQPVQPGYPLEASLC